MCHHATVPVNKGYIKNPVEFSPLKSSTALKKKPIQVVSGIIFSSRLQSSDEDTTQSKLTLNEYYENDPGRVYKHWRKHRFDQRKIFPQLSQKDNLQLDLISDLLKIALCILFRSLEGENSEKNIFSRKTFQL